MERIVMQGTVWASLKCTAQQDKLPIYTYKDEVEIPPIGYVDDVLTVAKCGNSSVINNSIANAFTESKKLKYGVDKCKQMHVGKNNSICPKLKVHEQDMKKSESETYLGDIITNTANNKKNIQARRDKGFGLVSEILSLMSEIPLGRYKSHVALILRQAMLINGMLFNSEAWSDVKDADIKQLEDVDEFLLRSIFKAHSKTSLEFLHLETGTVPIKFIVASRRLNYLHNILSKSETELIHRVYQAQKKNESPGDWVNLVREDAKLLQIDLDENWITSMSKNRFKKLLKRKMTQAALSHLNLKKKSKVQDILYTKLSPQPYIVSGELGDEHKQMLFALRSKMLRVKSNFSGLYKNDDQCSLGCKSVENQMHLIECKYLIEKLDDASILAEIEYSDIFGSVNSQKLIAEAYVELFQIREKLINENED